MEKPARSLAQLLEILHERGLSVDQVGSGDARYLYDNNYYRLSGYWRYHQRAPHMGDNAFSAGALLDDVRDVYRFDAGLRNVLLEGLSEFEVTFRSRFAYELSQRENGEYHYREAETYKPETDRHGVDHRQRLLTSITNELERSKERFVKRKRDRGERIEVWIAVEALSFGTISKMYRLLDDEPIREKLSKRMDLPDSSRTDGVLHSLSVLRNICAHHGRLWNRVAAVPVFVPTRLKIDPDRRIYQATTWAWMAVLGDQVRQIRGDNTFEETVQNYVEDYPHLVEGLKLPHNR